MKNIIAIIKTLSGAGISVFVEQGKLKTRSSANAITPEIASLIRDNKETLIRFLSRTASSEKTAYPSISARRQKTSVLSYAQQRLWIIDQIEGGSVHYNMPGGLQLSGVVNETAL
ncbi:MAG: hypothetical protein K2P84_09130, partial [Undibacterium sp.]|nr:hypothetical protein [Undibacterium sp.]